MSEYRPGYHKEIAALERAAMNFASPLRDNQGFQEIEYRALCDAIRACTARWANEEAVPKVLASWLISLPLLIDRYAEGYPEAERIRAAADELETLACRCVQPHPDVQQMYEWSALPSSP